VAPSALPRTRLSAQTLGNAFDTLFVSYQKKRINGFLFPLQGSARAGISGPFWQGPAARIAAATRLRLKQSAANQKK
jgi:hypothetical protein